MELPLCSRRNRLEKLLMDPAKSIKELTELTLNLYWASRTGNHKLVISLLRRGADPHVCHPDNGEGPLHTAAFHGHFKVLEALINNGTGPNVKTNFPSEETAMHILIKNWPSSKSAWKKVREEQCLRILLAAPGVDVDARDGTGETAVHLAARLQLWNLVEMLLQHQPNVDTEIGGSTARSLIADAESERKWKLPQRKSASQIISVLQLSVNCLKDGREDDFLEILNDSGHSSLSKADRQVCLKTACSCGSLRAVRVLLERGADPNDFVSEPPVVVAAKHGHARVLEALLDTGRVALNRVDHPLWQRSPLHLAVIADASSSDTSSYKDCVRLMLERGVNVDGVDFRGNTALHYAAKSNRHDLVRLILNAGSNLFICNQHGEPGFLNVRREDVDSFLTSFVTMRGFTDRNHSLELDYQFLKQTDDAKGPEMHPCLLLSRSKQHRALLKHPLITSFLHLKWQKLKLFFYLKFIIYFAFTVALSVHIYYFVQFNPADSNSPYSLTANSKHNYIRWTSVILLGVFMLGEVLEASVSVKKYLNSYKNCLKLVVSVLAVVVLFAKMTHYAHQVVATVTIISAYTEMALLIGMHPRFATYINMLLRVSRNFLGFFFLFSFLLFAFAFSFFVLYHDCPRREENCKFFATLGASLFKTVVMLTGELEAENLETDVFGYLLFLLFVLFVPICLLNLMTGLAVSDIAAIRAEAEVDLLGSKVELYADIESVLLARFGDQRVRLLGNSLPDCKLTWYLDSDNQMEPDASQAVWFSKFVPGTLRSFRKMEWLMIIEQALQVANKSDKDDSSSAENIKATISALQMQIANLTELVLQLKETSQR